MTLTNRRPHLVECDPGNNRSVLAGIDGSGYPTKSTFNQEAISRLRRQRHVEHLHRLDPSPLGHFIREVEVATGADLTVRLERYSEIDPEFVCALGGDQFARALHCIDGDRTR